MELSVVPVASKNINRGEIPADRTVPTFKFKGPLEPEHAKAIGALIVTVVDCSVVPPGPVQLNV
jgi:hypothetical protein